MRGPSGRGDANAELADDADLVKCRRHCTKTRFLHQTRDVSLEIGFLRRRPDPDPLLLHCPTSLGVLWDSLARFNRSELQCRKNRRENHRIWRLLVVKYPYLRTPLFQRGADAVQCAHDSHEPLVAQAHGLEGFHEPVSDPSAPRERPGATARRRHRNSLQGTVQLQETVPLIISARHRHFRQRE